MVTLDEIKEDIAIEAGTYDADEAYKDAAARIIHALMQENEKIMRAAREAKADVELLAARFASVFSATDTTEVDQ
ncbi:protein of unknown function [Pseudodesulfovibrio profundus]|uniref:Uncharacterized protein n=1 Tax=Pseudodesulfovibrio profundus TaxID=57320 RepID=A0A2C8FDL9_9BACT|nr:hypothetical protein [Pseudodesulfovibrio profundus]SOB60597.1 protein of unknown function [Pseudodesulfovibrio profundus]